MKKFHYFLIEGEGRTACGRTPGHLLSAFPRDHVTCRQCQAVLEKQDWQASRRQAVAHQDV